MYVKSYMPIEYFILLLPKHSNWKLYVLMFGENLYKEGNKFVEMFSLSAISK